jgi:hypothetical protein
MTLEAMEPFGLALREYMRKTRRLRFYFIGMTEKWTNMSSVTAFVKLNHFQS